MMPRPRPREADLIGLLGLARRAGKVRRGVEATRKAVAADEAELVLLAEDASRSQLRKVTNLTRHREVPVRWISGSEMLGRALGEHRLSVVSITDPSFAMQLLNTLPEAPTPPARGTDTGTRGKEPSSDAGH